MKKKTHVPALLLLLLAFPVTRVHAGEELRFDLGEGRDLQIFQRLQFWAVASFPERHDAAGERVSSRADLFLRRARIGMKGRLGETLKYRVEGAFDNLGRDQYTAAQGGAQNQENDEVRIWDARVTWEAVPDWANVTVGYFRPQAGRENITAAFAVNSFTKALTNFYTRPHFVGRSSGRETGLNLGGHHHDGWFGFQYDVGVFDTNHERVVGTAGGGTRWAPLVTGRVAVVFGDPERSAYGMAYSVNQFGERNGTTIGVSVTDQGRTELFDRNNLVGVDILSNYGDLNVSAEYDLLLRDTGTDRYTDRVWHVRGGYNVELSNGWIVEPALSWSEFDGAGNSMRWPAEKQSLHDVGVNFYIDGATKVNVHYVWQDDELDRGDYLAVGLQFVW